MFSVKGVGSLSSPDGDAFVPEGGAGGVAKPLPAAVAKAFFCNGMTREQRGFVLSHLHEESTSVTLEPVSRIGLPVSVPRTWILTLNLRALSPRRQHRFIENLGGVEEIIELATCHDAMVSEPRLLASILAERAR